MSVPDTVASARRLQLPVVRSAVPADYAAIRQVVVAAYEQYADLIPAPRGLGRGVARALLAACERLARDHGAPVFAFHTASFMTNAIALYERLGYRRAPEFDIDLGARFGGNSSFLAVAYLRHLTRAHADGARYLHCISTSARQQQRNHR